MNNSHEIEIAKLSCHVQRVLGNRLGKFYRQRLVALDGYLKRLLDEHNGCADTINDSEIEGAYEMVTEHLFPYSAAEMEQIMSLIEAQKNSEEGA
jgi:hypothetical protein